MKPNKYESKLLADIVTPNDIKAMFENAKYRVNDWTAVSSVNKGITKGLAYNVLKFVWNGETQHKTGITNAIREFGEYLPTEVLDTIIRKHKQIAFKPIHQEPKFD